MQKNFPPISKNTANLVHYKTFFLHMYNLPDIPGGFCTILAWQQKFCTSQKKKFVYIQTAALARSPRCRAVPAGRKNAFPPAEGLRPIKARKTGACMQACITCFPWLLHGSAGCHIIIFTSLGRKPPSSRRFTIRFLCSVPKASMVMRSSTPSWRFVLMNWLWSSLMTFPCSSAMS